MKCINKCPTLCSDPFQLQLECPREDGATRASGSGATAWGTGTGTLAPPGRLTVPYTRIDIACCYQCHMGHGLDIYKGPAERQSRGGGGGQPARCACTFICTLCALSCVARWTYPLYLFGARSWCHWCFVLHRSAIAGILWYVPAGFPSNRRSSAMKREKNESG